MVSSELQTVYPLYTASNFVELYKDKYVNTKGRGSWGSILIIDFASPQTFVLVWGR